jgi:hypothetical protein
LNAIRPFLDHILNLICVHYLDLYSYIINWISFFIQNGGSKIEIALILIGYQDTGKNKFLRDAISKLFGHYVMPNLNKISNIICRFNRSIENKIMIVCNDIQTIESAKHLNTDCLKSIITDWLCRMKPKFANNIRNFIFISNNHLSIKIE